jgi:hypothetical protein
MEAEVQRTVSETAGQRVENSTEFHNFSKENSTKSSKRKSPEESSSHESPKKTRTEETPLNSSTNSPKLFKNQLKRRPSFGKENSPTKSVSMAFTFSRLGDEFKNLPRTSSPKNLKQAKLSFEKTKGKRSKKVDTDATFCEALEKKSVWMSKSKVEKPEKKKSPTVQKAKTDGGGLFAFQPPPVKVTATRTQVSDFETPSISQLQPPVKIKEEKLSESDLDIFGSEGESSRGSSVICIEASAELPIEIPDHTVHSDDALVASLERDFLQQTEYHEESPPDVPRRKRKQFYGECRDCRDFYDKFAAVNGATQADHFVRTCPNACKASTYRKSEAQPKQPRPPPPQPRLDTPSGLWDMSSPTDDPDRTQDGL